MNEEIERFKIDSNAEHEMAYWRCPENEKKSD